MRIHHTVKGCLAIASGLEAFSSTRNEKGDLKDLCELLGGDMRVLNSLLFFLVVISCFVLALPSSILTASSNTHNIILTTPCSIDPVGCPKCGNSTDALEYADYKGEKDFYVENSGNNGTHYLRQEYETPCYFIGVCSVGVPTDHAECYPGIGCMEDPDISGSCRAIYVSSWRLKMQNFKSWKPALED